MNLLTALNKETMLSFSQELSIARPNWMGDILFPDQKTENLVAEYRRLQADGKLPVMANVHAFDVEARIGVRPTWEEVKVEKLLIKEKINLSERVRLLKGTGVNADDAILDYVFDDIGRLANSVKTRTEVAKMELVGTGKMTINENNLSLEVDYGFTADDKDTADWSDDSADVLGDIQGWVDTMKANGQPANTIVTTTKVLRRLTKNAAIVGAVYGTDTGRLVSQAQVQALFAELFGISRILINDELYQTLGADGTLTKVRYLDEGAFTLISSFGASAGVGLWGVTPEEEQLGQFNSKSFNQFITAVTWATEDPVAVWTKATGVFIPVLPYSNSMFFATITTSEISA